MHEQVPGVTGGLAGVIVALAAALSAFWLALGGTIWKALFEPQMKQLRKDREADNERCARDIADLKEHHAAECERLNTRITSLETMLITYGPMSLRAQLQTIRSAEQLAGVADHEGDDTKGMFAHRLPPKGPKQ